MREVDRPITETTKQAIEQKLATMGEYVKMSYLQRALRSGLDFETKRFALLKLAEIYTTKSMFAEAARAMKSAAEINTTYRDKIRDYMKAVDAFIKSGDYQEADILLSQALALGNDKEKKEIKDAQKKYYMAQASAYMAIDKRTQAKRIYEKIVTLELTSDERKNVQQNLLGLYEKLGNVREYMNLKRTL